VIYLYAKLYYLDQTEIEKAREKKKEKGKYEAVRRPHSLAAQINEAMLQWLTDAVVMCCG
jgi:hypothetical protein